MNDETTLSQNGDTTKICGKKAALDWRRVMLIPKFQRVPFWQTMACQLPGRYPLVNVYITMGKSTICHGKIHSFNGKDPPFFHGKIHYFNGKITIFSWENHHFLIGQST